MSTEHQPLAYGQPSVFAPFTSFAAATDLRAQSLLPSHSPQRLVVKVGAAGAGNLVVKDQSGTSRTIALANSEALTLDCAIKTIEISTITGTVLAFWWLDGSTRMNP